MRRRQEERNFERKNFESKKRKKGGGEKLHPQERTLGVEVVGRLDGVALALDRVLDGRRRNGDVERLDHERLALGEVDDRRVADVVVVVKRLGRPERLRRVDLHARLAADVVAVLEPGRAQVDGLARELGRGGQARQRAALPGVVADHQVGPVLLGAGRDERVAQVRRVVDVLRGRVGDGGREGEVVELLRGVDAAAARWLVGGERERDKRERGMERA